MTHEMKLSKEPFDEIANGKKTIELRLYDEKRQRIKIGDKIRFSLMDCPSRQIETLVIDLHRFGSFRELFLTHLFDKCGCGSLSIDASVEGMRQYYTESEEEKYGIVGIEICIT